MAESGHAPASAFDQAAAALERGRFVDAEAHCRAILDAEPNHFDAVNLLAIAHFSRGAHGDALASFERALAIRPDHADTLCNRGKALGDLKRFEEALASYEAALAIRPRDAEALFSCALILKERSRFDAALTYLDKVLAIAPQHGDALNVRGNTLKALGRFADALASYDRALVVRPGFAEALSNRGVVLHEMKRFAEALASYDRAIAARPDYVEALSNRGATLQALRRFAEALASYDRALAVKPDHAEALYNRGHTLLELGRLDEALASYDGALAGRPDYAEAFSNRGYVLHKMKRFDEALASYDRALAVQPDFADARHNEALCRLLVGDFGRGWEQYEARWETAQLAAMKRNFPQPRWRGSHDLAGKTILLHAEQGLGDTIQFCRYVPCVAERGGRVVLEVQRPLHVLMRTLAGAAQIVSTGDPLPDFDVHCPLLSLPLAFGTDIETIPSATPYLYAPSSAVMDWERRLGAKRGPRIGLAWAGNPGHKNDQNRSIGLGPFMPLLDIDATFVSLQKDVRAADAAVLNGRRDLVHFGDALANFSDTAALMSTLDLVISVDTSVAHLAGALGKPVWVLLPFVPDWRWLLDRETSPWYPTARLFRQDGTRTWDTAIARVHEALGDFVQQPAGKLTG
jgi:tetratricopeptide (TPR) repeat protein